MSLRPSTFRGYYAIGQVVAHMEELAQGLQHRETPCSVMTLRRSDLDLLQHWPRAAALFEIVTNEAGVTYWRGFQLQADRGEPRYGWT